MSGAAARCTHLEWLRQSRRLQALPWDEGNNGIPSRDQSKTGRLTSPTVPAPWTRLKGPVTRQRQRSPPNPTCEHSRNLAEPLGRGKSMVEFCLQYKQDRGTFTAVFLHACLCVITVSFYLVLPLERSRGCVLLRVQESELLLFAS